MILSLTHDMNGESGFIHVDSSDLLFLEYDSMVNRVYFHTHDDVYYAMGSLKYFLVALNNSGQQFDKVDRNYVVNLNQVVKVDLTDGFIYFESNISKKSKRCTVAFSNLKQILNTIRSVRPNLVTT